MHWRKKLLTEITHYYPLVDKSKRKLGLHERQSPLTALYCWWWWLFHAHSLVLVFVGDQSEGVRAVRFLHAGVSVRQVDDSGCGGHRLILGGASPPDQDQLAWVELDIVPGTKNHQWGAIRYMSRAWAKPAISRIIYWYAKSKLSALLVSCCNLLSYWGNVWDSNNWQNYWIY